MSEKGILKKLVDIFYYCEEIDNHLPKEEQTGYRMLPDIFYIKKEVNNLQQKVEQLENIRKEAIEYVLKNKLYRFKYDDEELFEITTDKKAKDDLLNILNKGDNK